MHFGMRHKTDGFIIKVPRNSCHKVVGAVRSDHLIICWTRNNYKIWRSNSGSTDEQCSREPWKASKMTESGLIKDVHNNEQGR